MIEIEYDLTEMYSKVDEDNRAADGAQTYPMPNEEIYNSNEQENGLPWIDSKPVFTAL